MFFRCIVGVHFNTEGMIVAYDCVFRDLPDQVNKILRTKKKVGVPPPR